MSGFLGMFGKKSEVPPVAPPSSMKPPAPRPAGVGTPPPIADFPSSIMGLKAPKPIGNKVAKSTQRIVLPAQKTGPLLPAVNRTGPLGSQKQMEPTMRIMIPGKIKGAASSMNEGLKANEKVALPLSIAFRSLPPGVLSEQAQTTVNPSDEFFIPLDLVVPQLPSGKIEFTVQQMFGFLPPEIFKSSDEIAGFMAGKVVLPMMEVFSRISAAKNQVKAEIPAVPTAPIIASPLIKSEDQKPHPLPAPLIPPPSPRIIPPVQDPEPAPAVNNLENLLAAAQNALAEKGDGDKTVEYLSSSDVALVDEGAPEKTPGLVPPPAFVAQAVPVAPIVPPPLPVTAEKSNQESTPLEQLLQAAQEALADVPVGDQTVVVQELQEDKIDIQEPIPIPSEPIELEPKLIEPNRSIPVPPPAPNPIITPVSISTPIPDVQEKGISVENEVELDLNRCDEALLMKSVRCSPEMAKSIISYRRVCGGFGSVEMLLKVPGMTRSVYYSITGLQSTLGALIGINEILNIPADLKVTTEQAIARIALWPGVRGCFVQKGEVKIGSLEGINDLDQFIAQSQECLKSVTALCPSEEKVHQLLIKEGMGSWILLQRGNTLLISGFQSGLMPEGMSSILEKFIIEFHEQIH